MLPRLLVAVLLLAVALAGALWLVRWGRSPGEAPVARTGWTVVRPPHEVSALAQEGSVIWAGGRDGVVAIDRATRRVVRELQAPQSLLYTRALLLDRAGRLWVGHMRGLTCRDSAGVRTYTTRDGLPDDRVHALLEGPAGAIWVGTAGGAAQLQGGRWHWLTARDGLLDDMVNVMMRDHQGGLWFGSYVAPRGGLSRLSQGQWQYFTTRNGLPHNNITSLCEDTQGRVWVGTGLLDRGGACCLAAGSNGWAVVRTLSRRDGLAGDKVRSLFQDPSGAMWFGSEYDGIARQRSGVTTVFGLSDGLAHPEVKAFLQDTDGNLWLATADGVTCLERAAVAALGH